MVEDLCCDPPCQTAWRTGHQERSMKRGSDRARMAWSPGFHHETGCRGAELSRLNPNRRALKFESQYVQHPFAGHRLWYCPNRRDRLNSRMTPAQSTFRARRRSFARSRAGLPNLTECPLARYSDGAGRSTQAASISHTSIPIDHLSPSQPHPIRTSHTARSHGGRHGHWEGTGITAGATEREDERKRASMIAREKQT